MLKLVDIEPPAYRDPAQMLRNIADDIESGKFADVETICVALVCEEGLETFGGGRNSDPMICGFVFDCARHRLVSCWGP